MSEAAALKEAAEAIRMLERAVTTIQVKNDHEIIALKAALDRLTTEIHAIATLVRNGLRDGVRDNAAEIRVLVGRLNDLEAKVDGTAVGELKVRLERTRGFWALVIAFVGALATAVVALLK